MKISALRENIITEIIDYREHKVKVELMPDLYTVDDAKSMDGNDLDAVIEYVLKGLRSWDIQDESGEELSKDLKTVKSLVPEPFLMLLFDRILTLKNSAMGKLKTLKV